ncbi:OprD family outer membrane porin [Sulfurimonas sp.]|uniref:OprD family outer membrane porin n=1 Tax=Sulfurimonas sp. TaxID=2022749 RepID=UPI0025CF3952|nr:OprD family outer membrane porin [Sulfurimonas sp.]MDD5157103.1 OprD family outer membrane porin [Sulfurimonas sp.]
MNKIIIVSVLCAFSLQASDSINTWFEDGKAHGNIRYYYINTAKETGATQTSQHANSVGGQLGYTTGSLYGLKIGATFMTTNPFATPSNPANVDTSILGRDNGVRVNGNTNASNADDGFSVLGEAYAQYAQDSYNIWYGRKIIETPLIDAKDVRMLPSTVQGAMGTATFENGIEVSAGYIDRFKQRTSNVFTNIIEHALGANTRAITGDDGGYIVPISLGWKNRDVSTHIYDYYAPDFMNSVYADVMVKNRLDNDWSCSASMQGIMQDSIGNANSAAAKAIMGGEINAKAIGAKVSLTHQETTLIVAYSNVASSSGKHDSLVLPWDGTPLFTNTITSNDLFISNYGKGLTSDTAYIGGTTGIKLGVAQKFDFTGVKGFKAVLEYAHYNNSIFPKAQEDINAVIGYTKDKFSLDFKGIWVKENSSASANGSVISQNDKLTQYRIIANYKF